MLAHNPQPTLHTVAKHNTHRTTHGRASLPSVVRAKGRWSMIPPPTADPRAPGDLLQVAFGGGVNGHALIIGMHAAGIRPDVITFADTGGEEPHTYAAVERMREWLRARGWPDITIVRNDGKWGTLEAQCLGLGVLPSLAYGWKTCSTRYKLEPQRKWMNAHGPARAAWAAGAKVVTAIGYEAGEERRTFNAADETGKYRFWFPLIEWGWDRAACLASIAAAGMPTPGKSSCFFCPAHTKAEVIDLAIRAPDLFDRAASIEAAAEASGKSHTAKGLGRHWSWREVVASNQPAPPDDGNPDAVPCGCYDG